MPTQHGTDKNSPLTYQKRSLKSLKEWGRKNLSYCRYLFLHKKFVYQVGRMLHVPIYRLLWHDWTKLRWRTEWVPYREHFYGKNDAEAFDRAWLSHIHRNPHHYEYWVMIEKGELIPLDIPDTYIRELCADWMAAGKAISGVWKAHKWYFQHYKTIPLTYNSRKAIHGYLLELVHKLAPHETYTTMVKLDEILEGYE